jgi:DNA invertase Pin-like site-specific DNA recombinase
MFALLCTSTRQIAAVALLVTVALAAAVGTCAASPAETTSEPGVNADIRAVQAPATAAAPAYLLTRGAGYGSQGGSATVRVMQRLLYRDGYTPGPIDGQYGPLTQRAVQRFQRAQGLVVDGVIGPQTSRRLTAPRVRRSHARGSPLLRPGAGYRTHGGSLGERRAQAIPWPAIGERPPRTPVAPAGRELALANSGLSPLLTVGLVAVVLGALVSLLWQIAGAAGLSPPRPRAILTKGWARMRGPRRDRGRARALGYVRSPAQEALAGREQLIAIAAHCAALGLRLQDVARDTEQPQDNGVRPPGLESALERLANGEASCLVVAQLGRLSRSAAELARILDWLKQRGIRLVAMDVELDTSTPAGRLAADALISVGALELEQFAPRNAGAPATDGASGAANGRPAVHDSPALRKRIVGMRSSGMTLQAIADRLNAEGVPTLRGGRHWRPSSVQAAVRNRRPGQRPRHRPPNRGSGAGGAT